MLLYCVYFNIEWFLFCYYCSKLNIHFVLCDFHLLLNTFCKYILSVYSFHYFFNFIFIFTWITKNFHILIVRKSFEWIFLHICMYSTYIYLILFHIIDCLWQFLHPEYMIYYYYYIFWTVRDVLFSICYCTQKILLPIQFNRAMEFNEMKRKKILINCYRIKIFSKGN